MKRRKPKPPRYRGAARRLPIKAVLPMADAAIDALYPELHGKARQCGIRAAITSLALSTAGWKNHIDIGSCVAALTTGHAVGVVRDRAMLDHLMHGSPMRINPDNDPVFEPDAVHVWVEIEGARRIVIDNAIHHDINWLVFGWKDDPEGTTPAILAAAQVAAASLAPPPEPIGPLIIDFDPAAPAPPGIATYSCAAFPSANDWGPHDYPAVHAVSVGHLKTHNEAVARAMGVPVKAVEDAGDAALLRLFETLTPRKNLVAALCDRGAAGNLGGVLNKHGLLGLMECRYGPPGRMGNRATAAVRNMAMQLMGEITTRVLME